VNGGAVNGGANSSGLEEIMRGAAAELTPIPTDYEPILRPIPGIRAVLFDLYGTLFVSEAGDIALGADSSAAGEGAARELAALLKRHRVAGSPEALGAAFRKAVAAEHAARSGEDPYPEIVAERIWSALLGIPEAEALLFAAAWEAATNKVAPMPGAAGVLRRLRSAGFVLGIVSNAQAYTPPLFSILLGATIEEFGFDPELIRFSWREGVGKPSGRLFDSVRASLAGKGMAPSQALFVGNDMLKDMYPARRSGLRCCLFAGDRRSLRLRPEDPRCAFEPDAAVLSLDQLPQILEVS
jgi:putative hydrolase of the HAD superfamily